MSTGNSGKAPEHGHIHRPDNHVIVLFGATGDLAKRKLLPGLFHLAAAGLLPAKYKIIGSSPAKFAISSDEFRAHARQAAQDFCISKPDQETDCWAEFSSHLSFAPADPDDYSPLKDAVEHAEKEIGGDVRRIYHLAVPPSAFSSVVTMLGDAGLAGDRSRVIIEKPFGWDLKSSVELGNAVLAVFDESQIFRIDHFLGKESVDNILAFRFANGLFEPVWNRAHIAYVQIDVPETLSIAGRADFYDRTGAYRDMIVTHLFQVLGFIAMEPPTSLTAAQLRSEKLKVFEALKPLDVRHVVRGQYEGYRNETGVDPKSQTETLVALRAEDADATLALARRAVLPALRQGPGGQPPSDHARLPRTAAENVQDPPAGRAGRQAQRDHHRLRRPRLDHGQVPGQGAGRGDVPGQREDGVQVRGLVRRSQRAGRLRTADPRRDAR